MKYDKRGKIDYEMKYTMNCIQKKYNNFCSYFEFLNKMKNLGEKFRALPVVSW